jgi:hypothetical protein
MPSKTKGEAPTAYPWAELYDLESRHRVSTGTPRRQGRPNRIYPRHGTSIMLSDEEMSIFDELHYRIRSALRPATVTKGQVHGLALRLLQSKAENLPERADSWDALVRILFPEED